MKIDIRRYKDILLNEDGFSTLEKFFYLTIIAVIIIAIYQYFTPYTSYYLFKTEIKEQANTCHMYTDATLAARIAEKAKDWKVDITKEDIGIERTGTDCTISVYYEVEVKYPAKKVHLLKFNIQITKPLKDPSKTLL